MTDLDEELHYEIVNPDDVHIHVCSCGQKATTRFMTGQEWYNHFEDEFLATKKPTIGDEDRESVLDAARKASGIE